MIHRLILWFEIWFPVGYRLCIFGLLLNGTVKSTICPSLPQTAIKWTLWKDQATSLHFLYAVNIRLTEQKLRKKCVSRLLTWWRIRKQKSVEEKNIFLCCIIRLHKVDHMSWFSNGLAMLWWIKSFWLDVQSHVTSSNQSECFISA